MLKDRALFPHVYHPLYLEMCGACPTELLFQREMRYCAIILLPRIQYQLRCHPTGSILTISFTTLHMFSCGVLQVICFLMFQYSS